MKDNIKIDKTTNFQTIFAFEIYVLQASKLFRAPQPYVCRIESTSIADCLATFRMRAV
jgi:hypothetical protein